jgi:hypothetical protein
MEEQPTHHEHDWLIFASTLVNPEDGQGAW